MRLALDMGLVGTSRPHHQVTVGDFSCVCTGSADATVSLTWEADVGVTGTTTVTAWASLDGGAVWGGGTNITPPSKVTTWTGSKNAIKCLRASNQGMKCTAAGLVAASVGDDKPCTVIQQMRIASVPSQGVGFGWSAGGAVNRNYPIGFTSTTAARAQKASTTAAYTVADVTAADHIYTAIQTNTPQQFIYVDNVLNGTTGAINVGAITPTAGFFGCGQDSVVGGGGVEIDGLTRRLLVSPRVFTTNQRTGWYDYMNGT